MLQFAEKCLFYLLTLIMSHTKLLSINQSINQSINLVYFVAKTKWVNIIININTGINS